MSELLYEIKGDIGYVVLNRPESRNALTFDMYDGLARICREVKLGRSVKVLIISGAGGKAFAAGTDISLFRSFIEPQDAIDYEAKMDQVFGDIERCPVPTIAAITGACTGGGAAIASVCDIRICDKDMVFGFPIARTLGNCLSVATLNRLTSLLGTGRVQDLLLTARFIKAEEAKVIGLVSEVLDDAEGVLSHADKLAQRISEHAPLTMMATKEGLRRLRNNGPQEGGNDLVVECYMSQDFKEGIEAFLAKRKPNWKGR